MQVKDIVSSLLELWNLMDSSNKERNKFSRIASVLGSSECDISEPGILSTEMIDQVFYCFYIFLRCVDFCYYSK